MNAVNSVHPGRILAEDFDANFTIAQAAALMGISEQSLRDITQCRADINLYGRAPPMTLNSEHIAILLVSDIQPNGITLCSQLKANLALQYPKILTLV